MVRAAASDVPVNGDIRRRFVRAITRFLTSEVRVTVWLLLGALVSLLLAISALNVVNSYVARNFMNAIEQRDMSDFVRLAGIYAGVFVLSTAVAVMCRFTEERLGLLWRDWGTGQVLTSYLEGQSYHALEIAGIVTNPDQRIAEDVRQFTTTTLSLLIMLLNGTLTILAFGGVLWAINRVLFMVAIGYAVVGSLLTLLFGRRLIGLNYAQADREADFRSELIHLRENTEAVALLRYEALLTHRLRRRFHALVRNARRIIAANRNLSFFTTGYSYFIQLVPTLVVAPLFIRGEVEFGVITQAAMAFSHLMGAFSLVVTQFPAISSQAVVAARLSALTGSWEPAVGPEPGIELIDRDGPLAYERVTLRAPADGRVLLADFTATFAAGRSVVVRGANERAKAALLRATAGLWGAGQGRIVRPAGDAVRFLTERPYLPPGTLRELLTGGTAMRDEAIAETLTLLGLGTVIERSGGFDVERDSQQTLALDEQQLLGVARVALARPQYVLLERLETTLGADEVERALGVLEGAGVTWIMLTDAAGPARAGCVLEIAESGAWSWVPPAT